MSSLWPYRLSRQPIDRGCGSYNNPVPDAWNLFFIQIILMLMRIVFMAL
jgi:hypothetical protein